METKVNARLTTSQKIGVDATFPFGDLTSFLKLLSPKRVEVEFHCCSEQGSRIDLETEFEGTDASRLAQIFQETLIRSEADLGFECLILKDNKERLKEENWICVEVEPEVICLPSGKEIAITLSLIDPVLEIFKNRSKINSEICYRVELSRVEPNRDYARMLIPALAELRDGRRAHSIVESTVKEAFELTRSGGWSAQERICVPNHAPVEVTIWVEATIRRYLNTNFSFLSEELFRVCWNDSTTHPEEHTLQAFIARLRPHDFPSQLLKRIVPSDPLQRVMPISLDQYRQMNVEPENGEYAFISYAHPNVEFVKTLILQLKDAGISTWHDSGIEPGSRWDEELEGRIRNCGVFIACVSDEYQSSKYCRREIKFADLIEKKILPVTPIPWKWGKGLQMMFQELQVTCLEDKNSFEFLKRKLKSVAPQIF